MLWFLCLLVFSARIKRMLWRILGGIIYPAIFIADTFVIQYFCLHKQVIKEYLPKLAEISPKAY